MYSFAIAVNFLTSDLFVRTPRLPSQIKLLGAASAIPSALHGPLSVGMATKKGVRILQRQTQELPGMMKDLHLLCRRSFVPVRYRTQMKQQSSIFHQRTGGWENNRMTCHGVPMFLCRRGLLL